MVLVRHLNKSAGTNALYRGIGTIALTAVARSVLLVAPEPVDPTRRVLATTKHSLCDQSPSLLFKPVPKGDGLVIEWLGETCYCAEDLLEHAGQTTTSQLHEAIQLLYSLLWDTPMSAYQVKRLARENGVADRTLCRAKAASGIRSKRIGFGPTSHLRGLLPEPSRWSRNSATETSTNYGGVDRWGLARCCPAGDHSALSALFNSAEIHEP